MSSSAGQDMVGYLGDGPTNTWQPNSFTDQDMVDFLTDTIPNIWQPDADPRPMGSLHTNGAGGHMVSATPDTSRETRPYTGPGDRVSNHVSPLTGLEQPTSQVDMSGEITKTYSLMVPPQLVDEL